MIALNLDAATPEHIILKDYLEQNASEVLAEKINNGVRIVKDGKTLICKKTLDTFWNYAGSEAQKLAAKGARVKALEHTTVFNWAIHYFEEDSLEGTLYNEDGTEYKPPRPAKPAAKTVEYQATANTPIAPKPKPMTLFDLLDADNAAVTETPLELVESEQENDEPEETDFCETETEEDTDEPQEELRVEEPDKTTVPPTFIRIDDNKCVDNDGVVHETPKAQNAELKIPEVLIKLFGSTMIVR